MVLTIFAAPILNVDDWTTGQTVGCIFGVAGGVVVLYAVFLLPYLYRKLHLEDWTLKPWHIPLGPLLWFRGEVPPAPEGVEIVQDYYRGHKTKEELETSPASNPEAANDVEKNPVQSAIPGVPESVEEQKPKKGAIVGPWYTPKNLFIKAKYYFLRGVDRDIVAEQNEHKGFAAKFLAPNMDKIHAEVKHYDNKTEALYSFLQVLTAATASFAHGANDVANAIGPLSTIYLVWSKNVVSSKAPVPVWILVFGGAAISKSTTWSLRVS